MVESEPTSGLDSHTALSMAACLKRLTGVAEQDRVAGERTREDVNGEPAAPDEPRNTAPPVTVIVAIHQPNYEVRRSSQPVRDTWAYHRQPLTASVLSCSSVLQLFSLFDDMVLMAGGRVVYCGPTATALPYFHALGLPCPLYTNPPEHFLDLAQSTSVDDDARIGKLVAAYDSRPALAVQPLPASSAEAEAATFTALPFVAQLRHLVHRSHLIVSRSPLLRIAQVLQSVALGLLVGLSFYQLSHTQTSVQNRLGAVYFLILCVTFANTFSVVLTFADERAVFLREQRARLYGVEAYFLARTSVDVLPTALCSLVFVLCCYFLMDFGLTAGQVFYFLLVVLLIAYTGQSLGLVVACLVRERLLAMILTPLSIAPFIVFTPYALPYPDSTPKWLLPCLYLSPFWWSFTALTVNEMHGLYFTCDAADSVSLGDWLGVQLPLLCPYRKGRDVLDHFGIGGDDYLNNKTQCVWALLILAVSYRFIAYLLLKLFVRGARNQ